MSKTKSIKPVEPKPAPEAAEEDTLIRVRKQLAEIRMDGGTQPRAELDESVIEDYQDAITDGEKFPPVDLFFDGECYWLADGFHRVKATQRAGLLDIDALIHMGTREDAQWFSYAANKSHGLRRTNADKQRAVQAALRHPDGANKSDRAIADHIGVDHQTVANWRKKMSVEVRQSTEREGRDGRAYNIGKRASSESAAPIASAPTQAEAAPAPPAAVPHLVPTLDGSQPAATMEPEPHGAVSETEAPQAETERVERETQPAIPETPEPAPSIVMASINLRDWARKIGLDPVNDEILASHIATKYYRSEAERVFRAAADRLIRLADLIAIASDDGRTLAEKFAGRPADNILEQIVREDSHV